MKTLISRLAIAPILGITLVAVITVSDSIAKRVERCQAAAMVNSQPGQEMLNGSFSNMMNTLNSISVR